MRFLISDTFAKSVAKLDDRDRRTVQSAAFGFQVNPGRTSLRLHKLAHPRGAGLWSLCVNRDLRIIVQRDGPDVVFCYADHHENAYAWAERRKWGAHPAPGAASLAVSERAQEVPVAPAEERPALTPEPACRGVETSRSAPGVELRRLRTRTRAAAPLAGRSAAAFDREARPIAQLLQLACRVGALGAHPARVASSHPASRARAERALPHGARAGLALQTKILVLSLLAAPVPILASLAACRAPPQGPSIATALAPGLAGALLIACGGLAAARLTCAAIRAARSELERIRDRVRAGHFGGTTDSARVDPALRPMLRAAEDTVEAFAAPFEEATTTLARLARGEPAEPLVEGRGGAFDRQREAIHALASFLRLGAEDLRSIIGSVPPAAGMKPAHIEESAI
jgi:hypothetical protein